MIVVFVVDTSPSMAAPSNNGGVGSTAAKGISRLDVAKMSVENMARSMDKRIMENNRSVLLAASAQAASMSVGKQQKQQQHVGRLEQFDEFLLLSSSLQPDIIPQASPSKRESGSTSNPLDRTPDSPGNYVPSMESAEAHASCGAGGRLLVGSVEDERGSLSMMDSGGTNSGILVPHPPDRSDFEHELKRLRTATLPSSSDKKSGKKFPEWAGGAYGLNAALSHGLGLLSRYRLTRGRIVEHFGMGRLPWMEHQMAKLSSKGTGSPGSGAGGGVDMNAGKYDSPLQPACLVLLTDGECLRLPPEEGGGSLSLRFSMNPLREFYREPFRWDQRIFILHIADATTPPLHKSLRALCEVTGGAYMRISTSVPSLSKILSRIAPPRPRQHSIVDPLRLPSMPNPAQSDDTTNGQVNAPSNVFVNGGPVCSFQCLEGSSGMPSLHRAMLLFAGACEQQRWILSSEALSPNQSQTKFVQSPIWCIPESHFPSKKIDSLPPRPSQPLLHYSRNYQAVGGLGLFDPYFVMKALHHLDHLQVSIRQLLVDSGDNPPPIVNRMLQRDVYICDWLGGHESSSRSSSNEPSNATGAPRTMAGREHFPICIRGAGRPALSEGGDNILNIGILHVPHNWIQLKDVGSSIVDRLPTLTLLPPDAHILIPLLIKVAELELRILKKATETKEVSKTGATAGLIKKKVNSATAARAIHLDDNWKSDFRAYLFRLPPYYLPAIRRVLRPMLPPSVLSLLNIDTNESLPLSNMSPTCLLKIQNGEKAARDGLDWVRGMEQNLRMRKARSIQEMQLASNQLQTGRNSSTTRKDVDFGYGQYDPRMSEHQFLTSLRNLPPPWKRGEKELKRDSSHASPISLLPSSCLLSYYESRRRWIFGGTGLTTRGLHVEGVNNDGVNTHHYNANQKAEDEPLIALAGCGADTINQTRISQMGDFKERLTFAPTTFVDYGGSSSVGGAATTASNGSPNYSVDDDVLPLNFFDAATGEFVDTPHARSRAKLCINFGNPFHDKRGGTVIPEKFSSQRPTKHEGKNGLPTTPPGSPPHDAYDSHSPIEGEGEAAFTGNRPASPSPPRGPRKLLDSNLLSLRKKRTVGLPLVTGEEKRRKASPPEGTANNPDSKSKPHPPPMALSRARPPPPRRHAQGSLAAPPPPPPKPIQAQKMTPQKPAAPKPAPPRRSGSTELSSPQHPRGNQVQKNTPQKFGMPKPGPPKRQSSGEASSPITSSAPSKPEQQEQDMTTQLQNPGVKPKIALAPGWICVWSKSQKRWYFFNTNTNKSVWDPEHIKASH
ncbi:hypothetical protein ACHAXR_012739 [Thalassiosira sp. AJA248-18]